MTDIPNDFPFFRRSKAEDVLLGFTIAAAVTGAIPVPAASTAVVFENAAMINAVASAMGVEVSWVTVVGSISGVYAINIIGKTLFLEGGRLLSWFGGPLGVAAICALGATTAAVQTWVLGQVVIAICEHGGKALPKQLAKQVMADALLSYERVRERVKRG